MNIRRAEQQDLTALVEFNQAMAMETENKQLDQQTLTAGVRALLEDSNKGFYLVAELQDKQIAGSLMVTYEWSDWRNSQFWWIQSVYVKPQNRRTGVYAGLYNKVKELASETSGVCGFRLYVEKDNLIAQRTYESLGMHSSHYYMYETEE
ncbi:GNAT family N-acetyltransferase [Aliiglaciecola litoralis]|uniref:GNAT family N-acetyltransferase n=1 Tax=Aliiglaciecola litoralis TaxID=582857 RepID=A0ABN1LEI7_9ALTE